ncbi:phosphoribosyl-AMP cyclohydrolase [Rubritalea spongiae]|uniref:Phosphoribosyl-AMP cyclohydrolase n=1 Tax=Rubritalea spongiae TaxID=430797 RepID=A0ABW5E4G9_9BACT
MSDIIKFGIRKDKKALEEDLVLSPKFDENGLIPCVAMDAETKQPLMLAYMNEQSLKMTLEIGEVVYYSRSRQEIWHKGATSGHTQKVVEIYTDCDQDAIIVYVDQQGAGACHTGRNSCFYRKVDIDASKNPVNLVTTEDFTYDADAVYKK